MSNLTSLLSKKADKFSQNGEDGIIRAIFDVIGTTTNVCCEFGAWDGIHLSNCRQLVLEGWSAVFIEGEKDRYNTLVANYRDNPQVICINDFVGTGEHSLNSLLSRHNVTELDFLSIDIDGLDYEVLQDLNSTPRVICIEVSAGHSPVTSTVLNRSVAMHNVGQPLSVMTQIAQEKGYDLVCYNANAFFIRHDVMQQFDLNSITPDSSYNEFISLLTVEQKQWLYLVNKGLVAPYFNFQNDYLNNARLSISDWQALLIEIKAWPKFIYKSLIGKRPLFQ